MKPIDPGKRTLLDGKDDGSRFLTYKLGEITARPHHRRRTSRPSSPPESTVASPSSPIRSAPTGTSASAGVRQGVGKTLSARHYAAVDEWDAWQAALTEKVAPVPQRILEARTAFYTPTVAATVRQIDQGLPTACQQISYALDYAEHGVIDPFVHTESRSSGRTELLIIDEADRLKATGLEQVRDYYDRHNMGVILIGMPGIEKRLVRYPQLYSRIGFAHEFRPLTAEELAAVLTQRMPSGPHNPEDNLGNSTAVATIARITGGNFRLVDRLLTQIRRIQTLNHLDALTPEVVDAARETLLIGH